MTHEHVNLKNCLRDCRLVL